jgi:hypothetical protein
MVRATRNVGLLTSPQKCGKWVLNFRSSVPTPRYCYTEAAAQGHEKVVSFLLSHFKALLQFENSQGLRPVSPVEASTSGSGAWRGLPKSRRISSIVNVQASKAQNSPLHLATMHSHLETTIALLQNGADCNLRNASGRTCLASGENSPNLFVNPPPPCLALTSSTGYCITTSAIQPPRTTPVLK